MSPAEIPQNPSAETIKPRYHHLATKEHSYMDYAKALERAKKGALNLMNELKSKGEFNSTTFMNVWHNSVDYQEAERLYQAYLEEAEQQYAAMQVDLAERTRGRISDVQRAA